MDTETVKLQKLLQKFSQLTSSERWDQDESLRLSAKVPFEQDSGPRPTFAIGIDLGTTNSAAAHCTSSKNQIEMIASSQGTNLVPSCVYFHEDGTTAVGKAAKTFLAADPSNTVYEAKRLIGRRYQDDVVQQDKKIWPFDLIDDHSTPKIRIRNKLYTPQEISSYILADLKLNAEMQLGGSVKYAVITVPAYFNDQQRQATVEAGEKAGFTVLRIINEPTASILAYSIQRAEDSSKNILVFDLGGGTFDVSIVSVNRSSVSVIAVGGDTHLGGADFDMNLVNYCVDEFNKKYGYQVSVDVTQVTDVNAKVDKSRLAQRVRRECEECKITLSSLKSSQVYIEYFHDSLKMNQTITREKFIELNKHLFSKCIEVMNKVRIESKLEWKEVDAILLVGGMTRVPIFKDLIQTFYQGPILDNLDKDESVAKGAAVLANILNPLRSDKGDGSQNRMLDIADVTPMSLGISDYLDEMKIFIPKNSKIPTNPVRQIWHTVNDNQTAITFSIYQGEHEVASKNCFLGSFRITNITPAPKREEKFDVDMKLDANGILHVDAFSLSDPSNKNDIKIVRSSSKQN